MLSPCASIQPRCFAKITDVALGAGRDGGGKHGRKMAADINHVCRELAASRTGLLTMVKKRLICDSSKTRPLTNGGRHAFEFSQIAPSGARLDGRRPGGGGHRLRIRSAGTRRDA
ncbi:hypothetical protein BQ8794_40284 [Mesorhizobium prunaredense]|uniref:Uncharacterized protein n=1 Tax=Mesorhizobium prunaredense TaxID=1631249 RepID=A0A1R3VFT1_9HYPH|nr:hypothetical protein BQ8794_40284 [Mesorhizobium prunaredense]